MRTGDTIAAIASADGRAARGIVRLSGPSTFDALRAMGVAERTRGAHKSRLSLQAQHGAGSLPLPALVIVYGAPRSYTGEDAAEILLPGNPALLRRVLDAVCAHESVRLASPGEFSARAFLSGRLSLAEAEGVAATISADSAEELAAARDLRVGEATARERAWADDLAGALALVEAGIDFVEEEDVVAISGDDLASRLDALIESMSLRLEPAPSREAPAEAPRVVLVGPPNAGKSTLFNALLGRRRAVVADVAGTTRDILEEPIDLSRDLPGAGRATIVDLAGLDARLDDSLDLAAQRAALGAIANADVAVVCDPAGRFEHASLAPERAPRLLVRTKADLPGVASDSADGAIAVCAIDGWNIPSLRRAIADAVAGVSGGMTPLRARRDRALRSAHESLLEARAALGSEPAPDLPNAELVAASMRSALDALGELVGDITPDDVIGRVFASFCVGK